jgi:hypothetical protein
VRSKYLLAHQISGVSRFDGGAAEVIACTGRPVLAMAEGRAMKKAKPTTRSVMPVQGPNQPEPLEDLQVAAQEQRWCP